MFTHYIATVCIYWCSEWIGAYTGFFLGGGETVIVLQDCFIIPQANLDRFLPDGVTVSFIINNFFVFVFAWKIIFGKVF